MGNPNSPKIENFLAPEAVVHIITCQKETLSVGDIAGSRWALGSLRLCADKCERAGQCELFMLMLASCTR